MTITALRAPPSEPPTIASLAKDALKQAAPLDILGGRFRLGVGIGWNQVEYIALNQDFRTRGRRLVPSINQVLSSDEVVQRNVSTLQELGY